MIKGVVLSDSRGFKIGVSERYIKEVGIYRHNGMFWATNDKEYFRYADGDYCDVAFWPFYNGDLNPESGEVEFCVPVYTGDNEKVSVGRHFYHEHGFSEPEWYFGSAYTSDREKGLDIDIHEIDWIDIEPLKIHKVL